ncbi:peptidoglycan-binding domain-containing protein, partial [Piscibacillus halophilus]|uniref:peptidoglycan-binding domain-containing protein n=1 Tax=Piscibacillus halophilus TaxID=571933 RepID=UPI00158ABE2B
TIFVFTVIFSLSLSNLYAEENLSNIENQNEENNEYIDEEKDLDAETSDEEDQISDESTDIQNANDEDKVTDDKHSETDEELNNKDSDEGFENNQEETNLDVNEEETSSEEDIEEDLVTKQAEINEQQTEVNSEDDELDVVELKENLVKLGFANWDNPDDQLNDETKAVLSEFQSYYQLNVTGEPTEETLAKIDDILSTKLQNGFRSEEAKIMKEKLVKLSFANWSNPTTLYASETEAAVRAFQNYYGLVVNGIGDEATLNKLNEILSTPLQSGYYSEEAKVLKEKLVFLDFADWDNPNTFYASQTEAAVKQLQSKYGLKAHGIADEVTLAKVEELMSMDPQKGLYRQDVIELKEKLVSLDFASWSNPNTYFGPQTEAAVKEFQA